MMTDEKNVPNPNEVIALFLRYGNHKAVAGELDADENTVKDIIVSNRDMISEVLQDIDDATVQLNEDGNLDVEKMMKQLHSNTLKFIQDAQTAMEPKEMLSGLGEARRQLELAAKMQGKFTISNNADGISDSGTTDFKQFLIQNMQVMLGNEEQFKNVKAVVADHDVGEVKEK